MKTRPAPDGAAAWQTSSATSRAGQFLRIALRDILGIDVAK